MVLSSEVAAGQTPVPNLFIDEYMPRASGSYVKAYLLLLRLEGKDVTAALLADLLEVSERDVLRALKYWKKQGLLELELDASGEIADMKLLDVAQVYRRSMQSPAARESAGEESGGEAENLPAAAPASVSAADGLAEKAAQETDPAAGAIPEKKSYPPSVLERLKAVDPDFGEMLFAVEAYLAHPLSVAETETFAWLYRDLGLPCSVLEYLVEYCVGGGHRSLHYMEKVALNWHRKGLRTLAQVREESQSFAQDNRAVLGAFGISGRPLTPDEREQVNRWHSELNMPSEVIAEACRRTIASIHEPNFAYAEAILRAFHEQGAHTMEAVRALPERRKSGRGKKNFYYERSVDYDAILQQEV